jgi:molybdopterin converting factor small subunit
MSVIVRVPTILRSYTGGEAEVTGEGATLRDVINDIETRNTGILARVLDENGKIRRFVNVYVNEEDVRFEQGLDTPTPAGTTISVLAAVAGG